MRPALPVHTVELGASGQAPAPGGGHRLRSQALALLVAAALEDEAPGLRLHALAEAMDASPLALLRLIGALHGDGESSQPPIRRISALVAGMAPTTQQRSNGAVVCSRLLLMPDRRTPLNGADSPCLKTSRRHGTACANRCAAKSPISSSTSGWNRSSLRRGLATSCS